MECLSSGHVEWDATSYTVDEFGEQRPNIEYDDNGDAIDRKHEEDESYACLKQHLIGGAWWGSWMS